MTDYAKLIQKYYTPVGMNRTDHEKFNKNEKHTPDYNRKQKQQQRLRHRYLILDQLINEIPFHITTQQTTEIKRWLERFNPYFREFHKNSSNETIILAFIFIQYKYRNPRVTIEKYSISQKYDLTTTKFTLIQNRLIFYLMRTTELTYSLKCNEIYENNKNKQGR